MATSVYAQDRSPEEAFRLATASGICGEPGVREANFNAGGVVEAICNEDVVAFVPLAGALAPALGAGLGLLALAAAGGGDATPDTQ